MSSTELCLNNLCFDCIALILDELEAWADIASFHLLSKINKAFLDEYRRKQFTTGNILRLIWLYNDPDNPALRDYPIVSLVSISYMPTTLALTKASSTDDFIVVPFNNTELITKKVVVEYCGFTLEEKVSGACDIINYNTLPAVAKLPGFTTTNVFIDKMEDLVMKLSGSELIAMEVGETTAVIATRFTIDLNLQYSCERGVPVYYIYGSASLPTEGEVKAGTRYEILASSSCEPFKFNLCIQYLIPHEHLYRDINKIENRRIRKDGSQSTRNRFVTYRGDECREPDDDAWQKMVETSADAFSIRWGGFFL
jgi:hypothetical protein